MLSNKKAPQHEWKSKTITYATSINSFVKKGLTEGWENAGPEPEAIDRSDLVNPLLDAIRTANETGNFSDLRSNWPLAHDPLVPILEENGQNIPDLVYLEDGRIIARIGASYEDGYVIEIENDNVTKVNDIDFFGKSPNSEYFAYTKNEGILITKGWLGEEVCICPYPTGLEGIPQKFKVEKIEEPIQPIKIIPFPCGQKVLLIAYEGIFVLSPDKAVRLLPTRDDINEMFEYDTENYPDDDLTVYLDMAHGAISNDGKFIAVGSQDSVHYVYNEHYDIIGEIGTQSSYPHYAIFSDNGDMIAFNSCHFYNGVTIGVPTKYLPGLQTESYEEDDRTPILEDMSRVYAGVYRGNEFIIGDASGYLRAFGKDGKQHWQHFIGSSIGDIVISKDQKTLICSTYAGFISILKLDDIAPADYEICTGKTSEIRRWLIWKNEAKPLAW